MLATPPIDEFLSASLRLVRKGDNAKWSIGENHRWEDVWARIEYHGIAFLLHSRINQLLGWPTTLLDRMGEEARLLVLWEATHRDVVAKLIEELSAPGIESVIMKGTALAYSFHEDPAMRRRGDTDLLIHPKDRSTARAILERLGWYQKDDPHGLYYQEGWLHGSEGSFVHSVDLHWEPSDMPVVQGILPLGEFFAQKQPMSKFARGAYRPDPVLMVLQATINQKWHALHGYDSEAGRLAGPRRLIWSIDFDLLIKSLSEADWARLLRQCEKNNIGPLVAEALRGMQQDMGCDLPEEDLQWLGALPLDDDVEAYLTQKDSLTQFWIDVRKARGLVEKSRLVLMRAFPPRAHLLEKYPTADGWPTTVLQGRLVVDTASRMIRKVGSR